MNLHSLKWFLGITPNFRCPKENGQYGEWQGKRFLKKRDLKYSIKTGEAVGIKEMKLI